MKPYAVVLSTVVLAAVSSTARADVTSPAEPGSADPAALALDAERSAEAHKAKRCCGRPSSRVTLAWRRTAAR